VKSIEGPAHPPRRGVRKSGNVLRPGQYGRFPATVSRTARSYPSAPSSTSRAAIKSESSTWIKSRFAVTVGDRSGIPDHQGGVKAVSRSSSGHRGRPAGSVVTPKPFTQTEGC